MNRPITKNQSAGFCEGWNKGSYKLLEHLLEKARSIEPYASFLKESIEDFSIMQYEEPQDFKGILTHDSVMPFGKWEGKKLRDIPLEYFQWIYDQEDSFSNRLLFNYAMRAVQNESNSAKSAEPINLEDIPY